MNVVSYGIPGDHDDCALIRGGSDAPLDRLNVTREGSLGLEPRSHGLKTQPVNIT